MATVKFSDEELLAFFKTHPTFRDRMDSIIGAVGNVDGDLKWTPDLGPAVKV